MGTARVELPVFPYAFFFSMGAGFSLFLILSSLAGDRQEFSGEKYPVGGTRLSGTHRLQCELFLSVHGKPALNVVRGSSTHPIPRTLISTSTVSRPEMSHAAPAPVQTYEFCVILSQGLR